VNHRLFKYTFYSFLERGTVLFVRFNIQY